MAVIVAWLSDFDMDLASYLAFAHARQLASRFEEGFEPSETEEIDGLDELSRAVVEQANAQKNVDL
jgi:hypothetical protein